MEKQNLASILMLIGGIFEVCIAIAHFIMPVAVLSAKEILGLPESYQDFVTHAVIAVGFCMMIFGLFSIYLSQKLKTGNFTAWLFCLLQGILWIMRTISEFALPVKTPLFFFINPTVYVLPLVICMAFIYLISCGLTKSSLRKA